MVQQRNPFSLLADRIKDGDETAIAAFREQLLPHLQRMVRRVVRSGSKRTVFDKRVHAEVEQITASFDLTGSELNAQVARRLFASILRQVMSAEEPAAACAETTAFGFAFTGGETVCEC